MVPNSYSTMDTAPLDGTRVLVFAPAQKQWMVAFYRVQWKEWYSSPGIYRCEPTHWAPLPPTPDATEEQP